MIAAPPPSGQPAVRPQSVAAATTGAGSSYHSLLGRPTAAWQVALGALGVLAASVPGMAFSAELNAAFYGDATPPMLAVVDVPVLASAFSVLVVPLLAELAEPVAYLGVVLPWLERRIGRPWIAATIVVVVWAAEHGFYPLLVSDGRLDLVFARIAWCRCCPSWPSGPRSTTPSTGGSCLSWRPGGSSMVARRLPWPWASPDENRHAQAARATGSAEPCRGSCAPRCNGGTPRPRQGASCGRYAPAAHRQRPTRTAPRPVAAVPPGQRCSGRAWAG